MNHFSSSMWLLIQMTTVRRICLVFFFRVEFMQLITRGKEKKSRCVSLGTRHSSVLSESRIWPLCWGLKQSWHTRQNETRAAIKKWDRRRRPGFLWPIFQFPAYNLQKRKLNVTKYENWREMCFKPELRSLQTTQTTRTTAKKVKVGF